MTPACPTLLSPFGSVQPQRHTVGLSDSLSARGEKGNSLQTENFGEVPPPQQGIIYLCFNLRGGLPVAPSSPESPDPGEAMHAP